MKKIPIPFPLIENMDDRSIVACLLNNESDVIVQFLYGKCGRLMIALYRKFKPFYNDAADVADECYLHVITPLPPDNTSRLQQFSNNIKNLFGWFRRCSINMCIERCREHRKIRFCSIDEIDYKLKNDSLAPLSINDERLDNDTHIVVTYDTRVVEDVLNHMSNKGYVEILRHRYFENLSVEETANVMGITKKVCSNRTNKAREQFKAVMRSRYSDFYRERNKKVKNAPMAG